MKKLAVMLLAALAFVAAQAQKPTWETKIWEGTQPPTSNGITEQEYDDGQHSNKVTVPTLTVYVPQKPCGLAILIHNNAHVIFLTLHTMEKITDISGFRNETDLPDQTFNIT